VKSDEEIMEVLEAFDLSDSFRDCHLLCRRIGPAGLCPQCEEPVAHAELDSDTPLPSSRWRVGTCLGFSSGLS